MVDLIMLLFKVMKNLYQEEDKKHLMNMMILEVNNKIQYMEIVYMERIILIFRIE